MEIGSIFLMLKQADGETEDRILCIMG